MRYVDTSILVAFLVPEVGSDAAEKFMTSSGEPLLISTWSEVELLSAMGVKLRSKKISKAEAHRATDAYTKLLLPALHKVPVHDMDIRQAALLMDGWETPLRAGDALHLAIASANHAVVYTFHRVMAQAGTQLGVVTTLLTVI